MASEDRVSQDLRDSVCLIIESISLVNFYTLLHLWVILC